MHINPKVFKAYDIRGVVPSEMNSEVGYAVGRAFAGFLKNKYGAETPKIILSRDARVSSPEIADSVRRGFLESGARLIDAGITATPMHYWIVGIEKADGGVMVTASHNPKEYNGLKLTDRDIQPISGAEIKEAVISTEATGTKRGNVQGSVFEKNYLEAYAQAQASRFSLSRRLKIVLDASNGASGPLLQNIAAVLPTIDWVLLNTKPDGSFPAHSPDPLQEEAIQEAAGRVKQEQADFGAVFDADGDRIMFVDEQGRGVRGDHVAALMARSLLEHAPGASIVLSVPSSHAAKEAVTGLGGQVVISKTGHVFMRRAMAANNAIFGAEPSGHFYFRDTFYSEDPILALSHVVAVLAQSKHKFSELMRPFQKYAASGEINFPLGDWPGLLSALKKEFAGASMDFTDGVSVELPEWWFNLRPSNTEPLLRLNVEAKDRKSVDQAVARLSKIIERA